MFLMVVEDRYAERDLRLSLASARARGEEATVLTGDALLAMRLRRDGIDARLTTDGLTREAMFERDRIALDGVASAFSADGRDHAEAFGTNYGQYLQYTLIPVFVRAVRNITAVDDALSTPHASGSAGPLGSPRVVLVGGGPLVDAARLVAERRAIPIETVGGDFLQRASGAFARLRSGRATRWVNTDFRALVLEPGFIWLLFLQGLWRRLTSPTTAPARHALVVVGDRFTADVVERLRTSSRSIVLAGATQPGRALFETTPGLQPIESFTHPADPLRWMGWIVDAVGAAFALMNARVHNGPFIVAGVRSWPLVGRSVWLHILSWVPALRHLQTLAARTAGACPDATLITSTDVTAYNRVLIDTVRRFGISSIGIQHGILGQANGHSIVHVDLLAIWGDESERWYREHARQEAQFVVTGNPRFDALAHRQLSAGSPALSAKPSALPVEPSARFTVTVCTGFVTDFSVAATDYENLMMLDAVIEWSRQHPGTTVIHKIHPGEEVDSYASAGRALGWDPLTLKTIREPILYDVLERSDVLVAAYSTTVLEAIALGTPAIVLDAIVRCRLLPLDEIAGISIALSTEELHAQLTAHLAAGGAKTTASRDDPALVKYIGQLDGGAAERIAKITVL